MCISMHSGYACFFFLKIQDDTFLIYKVLRKTRTLKSTCSAHRKKYNNKFLLVFLFNYIKYIYTYILHKITYSQNV